MKRHIFKMELNKYETMREYRRKLKRYRDFKTNFKKENKEKLIKLMDRNIYIVKNKILNKMLRRK